MIELNFTLLIQIVNFLLGLFIIIKFIIEPVMKVMAERQAHNDGVRQEAEGLQGSADQKMENYQARISEARAKTTQMREEQKQSGEVEAGALVEAANAEARGIREQAALAVREESGKARAELQNKVGNLSKLALDKVLGS